MVPTPTINLRLMLLFLSILTFIFITLLPSIIELKKPRDPGPRIIKDYDYVMLHDLEAEFIFVKNEHYPGEPLKLTVQFLGRLWQYSPCYLT
ncbi:MAG: hypothetical protein QW175_00465 [Candidatus Bathyarchaeia archaeon]